MTSSVSLVDAERGIVDPRVIILRPVEHDRRPFERVGIVRIARDSGRGIRREITLVFMIAQSNRLPRSTRSPAVCFSGVVERADDVARPRSPRRGNCRRSSGRWRSARPRRSAPARISCADHRGHAAGAIIILAEIFAGRLQIDQQRHVVAIASASRRAAARRRYGARSRRGGSARWSSRRSPN